MSSSPPFYYDYKADGFIYCNNGIDENEFIDIITNQ